jgi:nicotinamide-nucleotide amidase
VTGAEALLALARSKGAKIATAESCTGGLIAGAITEIAGSSDIFDRGFVAYSNAAKTDMLGVQAAIVLSRKDLTAYSKKFLVDVGHTLIN